MFQDVVQKLEGKKATEKDEKPAQNPTENEHRESDGSRKIAPYLTTFPTAMMKFQRKRRSDPSSSKRSSRQSVSLEGPYGLGCLVFPFLQRLNNIRFFMTVYCFLVFSQGIVFGLVDLSTAKFEKDYYLTTSENVALTLTYDISSVMVAILIAHYGGKGSRTKWVAGSSLLVGLGSLLFAVPYLYYEIARPDEENEDICQETKIVDACGRSRLLFQTKYIIFFVLGEALQGIAGMPLYILGATFIDDSVRTHSSGFYIGLGDAAQILGYGLSYAAVAPYLKVSQDTLSNMTDTEHSHRKWQISWWSSFMVVTIISWCTFLPLLFFPHSLPGTHKIKAEKDRQLHPYDKKLNEKEFGTTLKDLYNSLVVK